MVSDEILKRCELSSTAANMLTLSTMGLNKTLADIANTIREDEWMRHRDDRIDAFVYALSSFSHSLTRLTCLLDGITDVLEGLDEQSY